MVGNLIRKKVIFNSERCVCYDVMSGVLIEGHKTIRNGVEVYDFTYINWFWIGAALLSVFFALWVWNAKQKVKV